MSRAIKEFVLHKVASPNTDKVYIIQIVYAFVPEWDGNTGAKYYVLGKHGKRNGTIKTEIKGDHPDFPTAENCALQIYGEKTGPKKNYEDIQLGGYRGVLSYDPDTINWLTRNIDDFSALGENAEILNAGEDAPGIDEPEDVPDFPSSDFKVVCENALGMEGAFVEGTKYDAKAHEEGDLVWVTDENGNEIECLRERFKEAS